jgi:hypothetical protein
MDLHLSPDESAMWAAGGVARFRLEDAISLMLHSQSVVQVLTVHLDTGEVLYSLLKARG